MKHLIRLYLFFAAAFIALSAIPGYSQTCKMDSSFAPSDIDIVPTKVVVGKWGKARVNVFNSGTCTWTTKAVELSIEITRKPPGSPSAIKGFPKKLSLRLSVDPRKTQTWYFDITDLYHIGSYTLEFKLTNNGKPFGTEVPKSFEVVAPK